MYTVQEIEHLMGTEAYRFSLGTQLRLDQTLKHPGKNNIKVLVQNLNYGDIWYNNVCV